MEIYKIFLAVGGCDYAVKVNDVTIQKNNKGRIIATEIPVNEWMIYGMNTLEIDVKPLEGKEYSNGAHFELIFFKGFDREHIKETLFTFKEETLTGRKFIKKRHLGEVLETTFKTNLTHGLPVIDITSLEQVKQLYKFTQDIYGLFEKEDKEQILELFGKRQLDYSKCYGKDPDVYFDNLSTSLDFLFGNPQYKLLSFKKENYRPKLSMFGRLASIEHHKYNKHFINYYNKEDTTIMRSFYLYFALGEKESFMVCR